MSGGSLWASGSGHAYTTPWVRERDAGGASRLLVCYNDRLFAHYCPKFTYIRSNKHLLCSFFLYKCCRFAPFGTTFPIFKDRFLPHWAAKIRALYITVQSVDRSIISFNANVLCTWIIGRVRNKGIAHCIELSVYNAPLGYTVPGIVNFCCTDYPRKH